MTLETVALALGTLVGLLGFLLEWRRRGVDHRDLNHLRDRVADASAEVAGLRADVADLKAWRERLNRAA